MLVAASVVAVLSAAGVASEPALGFDIIEPGAFRANPIEELKLALGEADADVFPRVPSEVLKLDTGASEQSLSRIRDPLTEEDERVLADAPEGEDRENTDWCWWSAVSGMGEDLADKQQIDIEKTLEGLLLDCLKSHFPESESVAWVARALAIRDNLNLLNALGDSPEAAWNQLVYYGGITLAYERWEAWFKEDAAAMPPVP